MFKPPITKEGIIRYTVVIKYSVLIGLFYAFLSSLITDNKQVLYTSSGLLLFIIILLSSLNLLLISLSMFDTLKEYMKRRLFVDYRKTVYITFKYTVSTTQETVFTTNDLHSRINVYRC